ncbi:MAG: hypothetical protein A2786_02915 [Candidatus Chisholmbacteria bacterium RIFCSPHIGHO2_01_FULL_52_32]|uniref:Uncharacterized protein n=1 Tax=Candidatus Chisholmbacteria bacterium RIFCSPHIGHO2_01_FULL_52_32 TaxID=1797591 RepID=A0A1G1VSQ2_9BACT|nr:MAG: hypothetical protein A2786_02915 [Candidatus Chisholmbacteria bacterium RIFCSPHIGHO2_01_FULL_52_32]
MEVAMQYKGKEPWQNAVRAPKAAQYSSAAARLQALDRAIDRPNRQMLVLLHQVHEWEDRLRLRLLDGLVERMAISISGNEVHSQGMIFKAADVSQLDEDPLLLRHLRDARCPLKRLDVGTIGATDIRKLIRWAEESIREFGVSLPGYLEQLQRVATRISTDQLVWTSWLIYPTDFLPKFAAVRFSPLEVDEYQLWRYVSSLFTPVSVYEPEGIPGMLMFLPSLLGGNTTAMLPDTGNLSARGIGSSGGMYHRTLRIVGLGSEAVDPDIPNNYLLRNVDWLRDLVLPLLASSREQILIATSLWGVHEKGRKAFEKAERKKIKQAVKDYAEESDRQAREVALHEISRDHSQLAFRQSVVMSLAGASQDDADELYTRVRQTLDEQHVLLREIDHPVEHWDNFRTFVPDIRQRDVRIYTAPVPSGVASASMFRSRVRLSTGMGALLGYYTYRGEPVIIPVGKKGGGNYVATGTTGSGKSLWEKYCVYQLLPLDQRFVFRIMDNTALSLEAREKARGWKDLVELYGGTVLFADDPEFKNPEAFKSRLASLSQEKTRIILFTSAPDRDDLDRIWLKWLVSDIEVTGPGVITVDEMVGWFVESGDVRARLWVYELLKIMRTHNKISLSSIQSLVPILKDQPGVHGQFLTLMDGGSFAFYDPNEADLPPSHGIPDHIYPVQAQQIRDTNRTLKLGKLGPLQKPGFCTLITKPSVAEVKIEADPEVLAFLGRKDPNLSETLLWGD